MGSYLGGGEVVEAREGARGIYVSQGLLGAERVGEAAHGWRNWRVLKSQFELFSEATNREAL